ncbi:MAG TPA: DNA-binding protein YbiB [Casimicrobiaceae bacterium]|nr:DNA-binding protein YbiB [Casimicrobiaceae bacterium]
MTAGFAPWIREIGRGPHGARSLERGQARSLMAAMLDGEVPDLELGAILIAMRVKGETLDETLGFLEALAERVVPLDAPHDRPRPVVLPSYNGARRGANLTPLLALLLARYGVPVLVHGLGGAGADADDDADDDADAQASFGRVTSAAILGELGVVPSHSLADVEARLARAQVAYVATSTLSPGLARLLATRARVGLRSSAHSLAKLVDPFGGAAVRVVSVTHPDYLARMREVLAATRADAMLLRGTEGEPYANPKRCPRLEMFRHGEAWRFVDPEEGTLAALPSLPASHDAVSTARWIAETLAGVHAVPGPIVEQLALLLEAAHAPLEAPALAGVR